MRYSLDLILGLNSCIRKMSKFKVFWTRHAAIDLEEIILFIAEEKPLAARTLSKRIKNRCAKLSDNPERFRVVSELKEVGIDIYRETIISPYRVIYRLDNSSVYVIAVVDGRRDFESFLFQRLLRL